MTNTIPTKLACAAAAFVLTAASFGEVTDSKVDGREFAKAEIAEKHEQASFA